MISPLIIVHILLLVYLVVIAVEGQKNMLGPYNGLNPKSISKQFQTDLNTPKRNKRTTDHILTDADCISMTSEDGDYYHKAISGSSTPCGIYIFGEPFQKIEIHFNYLNVPCEDGGLVSFVDGWELNGQYFPSPSDHPHSIDMRFSEFCGQRKIKQIFSSSQNVALIRYRMPVKGTSFSFSIRFIHNPTPCNILVQNTDDIYTLRNYGTKSNCSISTLFPASARIITMNVGVVSSIGPSIELETGTIHKCQKRGLDDYVQIGGSTGLDNANMILAESLCGLDSKPGRYWNHVGCETTTIRLVSSGVFDNSVTVAIRQLEGAFDGYLSVVCPQENPFN